jgi:hypothetical protein
MKLIHLTVVGTLILAGCATSPSNIQAAYVSPVAYENMDCTQLTAEAQRVSAAAATATGQQQQKVGSDAVSTTVAVVLFWPALFFIQGDKGGTATEIANLKGQMKAIQDVNTTKSCGIQFQQG